MTTHESFKKRVRARMAETGEKYNSARRALLEQAPERDTDRAWVSEPEMSDEAVTAATGRGWEEWRNVIDAWPGHDDGHTAVARYLTDELGVDGWWAQTVTVGWERITGRRLPHQMPDGTFTANKSKTVRVDADLLRKALLHDADRRDLFPGLVVELRSKPASKTLRLGIGDGVAQVAIDPLPDGRAKVSVQHERLPAYEDVAFWKSYWQEWLEAIDLG